MLSLAATNSVAQVIASTSVRLATWVTLANGDRAKVGSWVLWWDAISLGRTGMLCDSTARPSLGRVLEIVQIKGHSDAVLGHAQLIMVDEARIGEPHEIYNMPQVTLLGRMKALAPKV